MKNCLLALLFVSLALPATAQDFEDARALVKASYEKTGGEKWKTVETMIMSTTMSMNTPQGDIFGTTKITFKYPGYTHVKVLLDIPEEMGGPPGGMTQTSVMRPDTTLVVSDMAGTQGAPGGQGPKGPSEELALLSDESVELSMEEGELEGAQVYIVSSSVDGVSNKYYYDTTTLYRVARGVDTGQGQAMVYFGDYREVDGLMLPFEQRQSMMGMSQTMNVKSIEVNPTIDDTIFDIK